MVDVQLSKAEAAEVREGWKTSLSDAVTERSGSAVRPVKYDPCEAWGEPDARLLNGGPRRAPEFPLDCLGAVGPWIADLAAAKGSPVDYAAMPLLSLAAGIVGAARGALARSNWSEPCVLWCVSVGNPGSCKSAPLASLKRSAAAIEKEAAGDMAERRREFETRKVEAKALRERWEDGVKKAVQSNQSASPMPEGAEEPTEPPRPRFIVADSTVEKLARMNAENPRGLVCVRDELSGLLGNFGKYGGEDAPVYLQAFNGDCSPVDRVKGGTITAPRMFLSLFGTIQPEKFQGLLGARTNDGLVSRFLVAWPDPKPRVWNVPPVDEGCGLSIFRRLRSLEMITDQAGELAPRYLPFTPEAAKVFAAWYVEQGKKTAGASGFMADFYGKTDGLCARVALVLELLEWAAGVSGSSDGPSAVSALSVGRACTLFADYFEPMARRVYADAALPQAERNAIALLREIKTRGVRAFNAREVRREWGVVGLSEPEDMTAALAVLLDGECVRELERADGARGRKSKAYAVNPRLFTGGAA